MAGVLHLWNEWEVQILVLVSFVLQVVLLTFAGTRRRRRGTSSATNYLLWLVYLLADTTAVYILGHMSLSSASREDRRLVAFWAPFLLVHLGGQDTITAYAMEDNQLWLRHLLTLAIQTLGAAYVLYKYIAVAGGSGSLAPAAALIFSVGFLKYGERICALKSASLDNISEFLDEVDVKEKEGPSHVPARARLDPEEVLRGAHDLLYICMGQFVDYKFWPSEYQNEAIKLFDDDKEEGSSTYELIEMQLSLMHDILYTKAAVIHTRRGCCIRAFSLVAIVTSFFLFVLFEFRSRSTGGSSSSIVDAAVTYILLAGALLVEVVSALTAVGSTWTCAWLLAAKRHRLHSILVYLRRLVRAAERSRRWSGSIGQHNLIDYFDNTKTGRCICIAQCFGCGDLWNRLHSTSYTDISKDTKKLVLHEIRRMVVACEGKEDTMKNYRGQLAIKPYCAHLEGLPFSITGTDFDTSILMWHFATDMFITYSVGAQREDAKPVVEAITALSNYMMFLLVERPHMLPSPVRARLYVDARKSLLGDRRAGLRSNMEVGNFEPFKGVLLNGAKLTDRLLKKEPDMPEVLQVLLGLWVEMLCYAAHHCSRDSHARQLNNGGEFITVIWLLTTAVFNRTYCDKQWFQKGAHDFFQSRGHTKPGCSDVCACCACMCLCCCLKLCCSA